MAHSAEGGAYGAALVAGAGMGIWPTVEEAVKVLKVETQNTPIRENVRVYDKLFRIYQDLYGNLKHSFDQISEIYS
jgi:xylulokinase